jgi:FAD/FMN-containing dehydrogenase
MSQRNDGMIHDAGTSATLPFAAAKGDDIMQAFSAVLGPAGMVADDAGRAPYETDWRGKYHGRSLAVLRPADTAQVAAVMRICAHHGIAIVPQGGNTGLCGGATPNTAGRQIILSLQRMRRLRSIDAEGASITCEAGMPLAEAQGHAEAAGLLLPISIASEGTATVGGAVATNAGGLNVLHYGSMRGMVLGVEAVLPDGSLWSDLGGLRKDNTGYAVSSLLTGSEGTLAVVTAACLALSPRPSGHTTFLAGLDDPGQALAMLSALRAGAAEAVTAWELFSTVSADILRSEPPHLTLPLARAHGWYLLGEVSHFGPPSDAQAATLERLANLCDDLGLDDIVQATSQAQRASLWALREGISTAERSLGPSLKHDVSVSPGRVAGLATALVSECADLVPGLRLNVFGHVGDGNLHINALPLERGVAMPDRVADAVTRHIYDRTHDAGGSFSAEHGVGQAKRAEMLRYKPPDHLRVLRAIKSALDPQGLMNPGKVLP